MHFLQHIFEQWGQRVGSLTVYKQIKHVNKSDRFPILAASSFLSLVGHEAEEAEEPRSFI